MKLVKFLRSQLGQKGWIGISFNVSEDIEYYKIEDIIQKYPHLLNYHVWYTTAQRIIKHEHM
jgi:hypothetical protein